jgi:hypothetical protein
VSLAPTLAGIAWDPQVRNILAFALGVTVLMGSVYLLLATNVATRLGFLLVLTGFFGWMIIHGTIWWIYPPGQGPTGRIPAWQVQEIVYGNLDQSNNPKVRLIQPENLPTYKSMAEFEEPEAKKVTAEQGKARLGPWRVLGGAEATKGEAQAALDTVLATGTIPGLEDPTTRVYTYAFGTGGKPERQGDSVWDRITNRVTNTLRIKNPPHYTVVQFQPAVKTVSEPGKAPPPPAPDPKAQVISAVLIRNIGQRRVPAALLTIGSGLIFGVLCAMLHRRDRRVAENRSVSVPATTGG